MKITLSDTELDYLTKMSMLVLLHQKINLGQ